MASSLEECQKLLGRKFRNPALLQMALTHPSSESAEVPHNERLEFLGDAVLGMVVCADLYRRLPEAREGELTRVKSVVVSRSVLARAARTRGLGRFVRVGRGMAPESRLSQRVLGDACEAIMGALYLDGGVNATRAFIMETLGEEIERVVAGRHRPDFKSLLQQFTQARLPATPTYEVLLEKGPDHLKRFRVAVMIRSEQYEWGEGKTKKEAEQEAARKTYRRLSGEEGDAIADGDESSS